MSNNPVINGATDARANILRSIRAHLAESARVEADKDYVAPPGIGSSSSAFNSYSQSGGKLADKRSLIEIFRQQLESVGAHCLAIPHESELTVALKGIFAELQSIGMQTRRIALSDAPILRRLAVDLASDTTEISITPGTKDLFCYDIGITTAQAAIAETGTLVLESDREKHRLTSLLPPVHIAVVDSQTICATLGDGIRRLRRNSEASRAITFITGPSRTADIELTLTIGVHGPKELYVIVNEGGTAAPSSLGEEAGVRGKAEVRE